MHPVKAIYNSLTASLPPVRFAFAYGSAVYAQRGRSKGNMIDMVLAVDDPVGWHRDNLEMNWNHYSNLRYIGPGCIAYMQGCGAGVYYNPFVMVDSQVIKYGVISMKDLIQDLTTWKWLYISGRLHKPVLMLTDYDQPDLSRALTWNLKYAALCGVLMVDDHSSEEELYCKISGLSYQGDFRMYFGEDKNKVYNIVQPNLELLKSMYKMHLEELVFVSDGRIIKKNKNLHEVVKDNLPHYVVEGMKESSLQEGLIKSLKYSYEKIGKMLQSREVYKH